MVTTFFAPNGKIPATGDLSSHEIAEEVVALLGATDRFSPEDIALCTGALLDKLRAVPLHDTIYLDKDSGTLYLDGKPMKDEETQERFLTYARDAKANRAATVVRELISRKVEYATSLMVRNASTPYDLVFAKAAMWAVQQIDDVYEKLLSIAQPDDSASDDTAE